jgi:hypothetical protein
MINSEQHYSTKNKKIIYDIKNNMNSTNGRKEFNWDHLNNFIKALLYKLSYCGDTIFIAPC